MNEQTQEVNMVTCILTGQEVPENATIALADGEGEDAALRGHVALQSIVQLAVTDQIYPAVAQERQRLVNIAQGRAQGQQEGLQATMNEMAKIASELGDGASFEDVQAAFAAKLQPAAPEQQMVAQDVTEDAGEGAAAE